MSLLRWYALDVSGGVILEGVHTACPGLPHIFAFSGH